MDQPARQALLVLRALLALQAPQVLLDQLALPARLALAGIKEIKAKQEKQDRLVPQVYQARPVLLAPQVLKVSPARLDQPEQQGPRGYKVKPACKAKTDRPAPQVRVALRGRQAALA